MGVDLLNIRGLKELEHQGPVVMEIGRAHV